MIKFRNITVEGFGSICDQTRFDFTKGLHIIKGHNGAGKTTIFNALYWCLFKDTLKNVNLSKISTWADNRTETYRGTRVILLMDIHDTTYMVARHYKFKGKTKGIKYGSEVVVLKHTDSGFIDVGEKYKKDIQIYINGLLGFDKSIFLNSVLFGQRLNRFTSLKDAEKRTFFEGIFELEFVGKAKEQAVLVQSELFEDIDILDRKCGKLESKRKMILQRIEDSKEAENRFFLDLDQRREKAQRKLTLNRQKWDECSEELEILNNKVGDLEKVIDYSHLVTMRTNEDKKLRKVTREINQITADIRNGENTLSASDRNITKHQKVLDSKHECGACGQPLKKEEITSIKKEASKKIKLEEDAQVMVNNMIESLKKDLPEYLDKRKDYEKEIQVINASIAEIDSLKEKHSSLDFKIHNKTRDMENHKQNIDFAHGELLELKDKKFKGIDIAALKVDLSSIKDSLEIYQLEHSQHCAKHKKMTWWIKKGFGSSGLKSYVFQSMLGKLNSYISNYTVVLGFNVTFGIDFSKESKPFTTSITKNETIVDYNELSGGQKQRIDIVIAFAIHDLISQTSNVNILILDECFTDLDAEGIELIFELVAMKNKQSVYVITHREYLDILNANIIEVSLDGNSNTIIN